MKCSSSYYGADILLDEIAGHFAPGWWARSTKRLTKFADVCIVNGSTGRDCVNMIIKQLGSIGVPTWREVQAMHKASLEADDEGAHHDQAGHHGPPGVRGGRQDT